MQELCKLRKNKFFETFQGVADETAITMSRIYPINIENTCCFESLSVRDANALEYKQTHPQEAGVVWRTDHSLNCQLLDTELQL